MPELSLVDAHCHLDEMARRGLDVGRALESAHRASVHQVVTSGDGLADSRDACALADLHSEVYFTAGWHPSNPRPPTDHELDELRQLLRHPRAVAVGEIGLDYLARPGCDPTPRSVQREMFRTMLALAAEVGLPVVVHQRLAHADVLQALDQGPGGAVMLHCFSGDAPFAAEAAERGLMCSFAGNVTFSSAQDLRSALRAVPAELLMLETDAPFLAPHPTRGTVCEPAMVRSTASRVALERGECLETLAAVTSENARGFFQIPVP
ncbi:MAG: TatD family hydrolase [Candidatus Dormibacteraeota bacterium]|jgi:TatD DNase family protein|nr:TatD family hydrolase [Candidatus Dormibacteraeota bacterium]